MRLIHGLLGYDLHCLYFLPEVRVKLTERVKGQFMTLIECNSGHICGIHQAKFVVLVNFKPTRVAGVLFTAYIIHVGFFYRGNFNDIGDKTEDGTNPKQHGKATEQLFTELHPLRGGGWRGQAIRTISLMQLICSFLCMTL